MSFIYPLLTDQSNASSLFLGIACYVIKLAAEIDTVGVRATLYRSPGIIIVAAVPALGTHKFQVIGLEDHLAPPVEDKDLEVVSEYQERENNELAIVIDHTVRVEGSRGVNTAFAVLDNVYVCLRNTPKRIG